LIPSGEIHPVAGTPFDFSEPSPIGAHIRDGAEQVVLAHGIDHNFVLNRPESDDASLMLAATVRELESGRTLKCYTTEPGIQVYTGNFLNGSVKGTSGSTYRQGDAFALETQHFPDSPNQPAFPSTVLRPGQRFESTTLYSFSS
jgi:aldose 1-epimerase